MDLGASSSDALTLRVLGLPERGLREVLSAWSASGSVHTQEDLNALLAGLGRTALEEREWSAADVRRRAARTAWGDLRALVLELPQTSREWIEALPGLTAQERIVSDRLLRPTAWAATVRANRGWPVPAGLQPRYVARRRERTTDSVLISALRWTRAELKRVHGDAAALLEDLKDDCLPQRSALADLDLPSGVDLAPEPADLRRLRAEGSPWNTLALLAEALVLLRGDLVHYAARVICPEPSLRWRLFHLATYGELLAALRERDYGLQSEAPLTGGASRPTHRGAHWTKPEVELWFEASGCWSHYGKGPSTTAYADAMSGLRTRPGALTPDCLVVAKQGATVVRALVLECKYSGDSTTVGRDGYLQALAYGVQASITLDCPVTALVVGPDDVVLRNSATTRLHAHQTQPVTIGATSPALLGTALASWMP